MKVLGNVTSKKVWSAHKTAINPMCSVQYNTDQNWLGYRSATV